NDAAQGVLGLKLDEIGRLVGKRWGLPNGLVASLTDMPPRTDIVEPLEHTEWLAAVSTMSTRCATVLCEDDAATADLVDIASGYAGMLGLEADAVLVAIDAAQKNAEEETAEESGVEAPEKQLLLPLGKPADSIDILQRGVADMCDEVMTSSTGQMMTVALETVYQGLGLSRAIAFLRHHEEGRYVARMCLGECTEELLPRLKFSDAYQPDVFHASLANAKMIYVEDARARR